MNGAHDEQVDAMTEAVLHWHTVAKRVLTYQAPSYQISPI